MADYDRTGHGLEVHWAGQGRAGRTWLGREGLVLVCQQNRGSQDRHRPVLSIGVLLVYVVYLDITCLSLPYPVLPGFARSCPNLPRPIRTQFALSWSSPILTGSVLSNTALPAVPVQFCWPRQVLLGLVQPCSTLTDLLSACPTLPGPVWCCSALLCLTLSCPIPTAQPWPALHEPARSRPTLPILSWTTQPGSTPGAPPRGSEAPLGTWKTLYFQCFFR